jgi:hypothetical protein
MDNLINAITAGKSIRYDWNKITGGSAYTAGRAYDLSTLNGSPVATAYPGTALVAQTFQESTGDGTATFGIPNGGNVSSDIKHILNMAAWSTAATGVPGTLILCDFLMAYPGINMNTLSAQTLINANTVTASSSSGLLLTYTNDFTTYTQVRFTTSGTLPTGLSLATDYWLVRVSATTARVATSLANAVAGTVIAYTDAGTGTHTMTVQIPRYTTGTGTRAFLEVRSTTGATGHNLSYSYTDQDGNSGATNPVTVACTASAIVPHITHSGIAANNYGPFLPLATGDSGIRSFQTVTLSAASGSASTAVLVIVRPLAQITLSISGLMTEKDLLNQIPSLPRVIDGACLGFIYLAGAATASSTTFAGSTEFVWG